MHVTTRFRKRSLLTHSTLLLALIFACSVAFSQAKDYAHIVVFGDSLSDTGNVTHLSMYYLGVPIPGQVLFPDGSTVNYTTGRFTDGTDTNPAAILYHGVWVEQLAESMPSHPAVINSLDEGSNYAYGYALTGTGTTELDFAPGVFVENMGQQIDDYLKTTPTIDSSTLFIIWGGANDVNRAAKEVNPADAAKAVENAAIAETLDIQQLIDAGATQFLVLNMPPLGLIPRVNGSPTAAAGANALASLFNSWLNTGIAVLHDTYGNRHVTLTRLDVYSLFNQIVANPGQLAFTNVTSPSWYLEVNPDTYLFWDDLHPTTRGHNLLAKAAMKAMTTPQCTSYGLPSCAAAIDKWIQTLGENQ